MATESYKKMNECVYESIWPDLPIPLQKYFIFMIQNTQKPMFYAGFGMLKLNLETFFQVRTYVSRCKSDVTLIRNNIFPAH